MTTNSTFTPDSELNLMFSINLIPNLIQQNLPSNLHLRPLASTDHSRSHLKLLSDLTHSPSVPIEAWEKQFNQLSSCPETYYPIVVVDKNSDQLVACGTLVLERKFIRGLGMVGHIEDITVGKESQGNGLGKVLLKTLVEISEKLGAYKVSFSFFPFMLNCY